MSRAVPMRRGSRLTRHKEMRKTSSRKCCARFLQDGPLTYEWRHVLVDLGPRPGVACFARRGGAGSYEAQAVDVLEIDQGRIRRVTSFLDPRLFGALGLPQRLSSVHPAFST